MTVHKNISSIHFEPSAVAVGSFDGVHCGHRMLLHRVTRLAEERRLKPVALTFWPHPRHVLPHNSNAPMPLLNTLDERTALLEQTGISDVVVLPFNTSLSQMTAADFVKKIIIGKLNAQYLAAGHDHHFGKGRSGDVQQLATLAAHNSLPLGIEVLQLEKLDRKISSSAIRTALLDGQLELANRMLGYEYTLSGTVITGNRLGRTIGFPTANIRTPQHKLLPKEGVYRARVNTAHSAAHHTGMMYIGQRPVLQQNDSTVHVEVHILDFDRQIYGQEITLELTHRIRDGIKFDSMQQLAAQLHRDRQSVIACR